MSSSIKENGDITIDVLGDTVRSLTEVETKSLFVAFFSHKMRKTGYMVNSKDMKQFEILVNDLIKELEKFKKARASGQ